MTTTAPRVRPRALVGALLTVAGGIVAAVGTSLVWFSIGGEDFDAFASFADGDGRASGVPVVSLAAVVSGVGVITLVARRIVPIALAGFAAAAAVAVVGVLRRNDLQDSADEYAGVVELGSGPTVVIAGGIVATIGSLLVLARRTRRP